jgi:hypothetical protein
MSRGQAKPGIDWLEIRRRIEAGAKIRETAREFGIKHQSIQGRAKSEGWSAGWAGAERKSLVAAGSRDPAVGSGNGRRQVLPLIPRNRGGLRCEDNKLFILKCVAVGFSLNKAASLVGFTDVALRLWQAEDEEFRQEIMEVAANYAARHLDNIDQASDRGDWKASERLLESNAFMRDEFKPADKGGGITVIINVPRPDMKEIGQIIDVEPEEVA